MTLRSIEMQIALPRVNDAGNIQHQLAQKPAYDQNMLAMQTAKQAEMQLKRSTEVDEAHTRMIGEDEGSEEREDSGRQQRGRRQASADRKAAQSVHPYKGKHIDLSL